jgi:hypothetical protein
MVWRIGGSGQVARKPVSGCGTGRRRRRAFIAPAAMNS